jgi:hypothetical protein
MTIAPDMSWTQAEAIELCRLLEDVAPSYGAHVALTGGTLYKRGNRRDVDIMFYRIRQKETVDETGLLKRLVDNGFSLRGRYGWVQKATYKGKDVDLFFPNTEVPEYVPGSRVSSDPDGHGY